VRSDPADPDSPRIGRGRFHAELWLLSTLGLDLSAWGKAQLVAARFFVDGLLPFVLLFAISAVTPPVRRTDLDRFFARQHTPVQATPQADREAVETALADPGRHDHKKIWPRSSWEILRPSLIDWIGFGGSWLLVGVVIALLWLMITLGS
jgi:SSS family solute:Na+ symporter